ncbi:restriction endonuclease subunit S [Aeromonas veronii]|uniref:restriction endonuclease subunit S n=1 Tax=Aeromonas veronii TaxID=654 RepID=UPI001F19B193|nr:restriction endonuclease subunit S [Aeromonas veronii]MCF5841747.1 restriction endonuclease subunit S [Aeromonas veronii]
MSEAVATSQQGLVEKYQPYPEYDDSGIEWLGRIPVHWKLATLKYECVFSGGGTPTKDNLAYWGGDIPWISPKDMKSQVVTDSIDKITAVAVAESSTKLVPEGALLMVVRSGILQRTIPVAINTVPVTLNQDMKALRFKSKDKACFFLYYIQGLESQLLLEWCKQGATVESIEHELLANARYPLPPNDELKAINQFLDYETARIDRLITQQLRLIELLKEKRQAVISHAVTKGLNPDAPMKDSGIEWLGQVPKHWQLTKLKWVAQTTSGSTPNTSEPEKYYDGGEYPWVRTTDLNNGTLTDVPVKITERAIKDTACTLLPIGSVLISMYGGAGSIGKHALLKTLATTNQAVCAVLPNSRLLPEYLNLFAEYYRPFWMASAEGTRKDPNIGQDHIREMFIPVPPLDEQRKVEIYVSGQLCLYDKGQDIAFRQVELLKERRTALISAAVTGKIDLRGWTPPAEEVAA